MNLNATNLQDASHFRTRWMAIVPAGSSLADVTKPDFWVHVAAKLGRMDVIEVLPEDEAWFAELLVLATAVGSVKVMVLREVAIDSVEASTEEFSTKVEWGGPAHKHRVIRISDNTVVSHGHSSKAEAQQAQVQYEKALAA